MIVRKSSIVLLSALCLFLAISGFLGEKYSFARCCRAYSCTSMGSGYWYDVYYKIRANCTSDGCPNQFKPNSGANLCRATGLTTGTTVSRCTFPEPVTTQVGVLNVRTPGMLWGCGNSYYGDNQAICSIGADTTPACSIDEI